MKKVLITGCNGLVGSYLRDLCLDRGWEVVGVDRNPTKRISRNFNYRFKKIDLLIEQNIVDLFKEEKYDAVFNCFGIKGSPIKAKNKTNVAAPKSFNSKCVVIERALQSRSQHQ
jgi:nucleoside-diphosphate-sugar epimerase